jgi:predicted nucleotidyltransferase
VKLHIYNKTLDPNLWNDDLTIKPEVRDHLLKVAEDFYSSTNLEGEVHNILFLGSSANYNWTPSSDIDLHIVIDIADEKINDQYARKFMDSLSFKWNTEHEISVKSHPIEVYLQDVREPNSNARQARKGTAIYSLFDGEWILKPERKPPTIDAEKIRSKFKVIEKKVDNLVSTRNIDKLKELMTSIRNYRDAGLHDGGEFSVENLVFKTLRKTGTLGKIKDTINTVYDKSVSLPENGNMQPTTETSPIPVNESNETENYLVVGWVNQDLDIVAEKDTEGLNKINHPQIAVKHQFIVDENSEQWRYKSLNNTVYWYGLPSEKEKGAVEDYLKEKYDVVNVKHTPTIDMSAHKINEKVAEK